MDFAKIGDELVRRDWVISVKENKDDRHKTDITMILPDGRLIVQTFNESPFWVSKALLN